MRALLGGLTLALILGAGALWGCASTNTDGARQNPDVLTREQILEAGATNL